MPHDESDHDRDQARTEGKPKESIMGRAKTWGIVALVVLVAAFALAAFLPRWWNSRISSIVGGNPLVGGITGLVVGFVFTFVPLAVLVLAIRNRQRTGLAITLTVVALVLAVPNLVTLWISVGRSTSATSLRSEFVRDAPWFRGWTLIGVILAGAAFGYLWYLVRSRNKARAEAKHDHHE